MVAKNQTKGMQNTSFTTLPSMELTVGSALHVYPVDCCAVIWLTHVFVIPQNRGPDKANNANGTP